MDLTQLGRLVMFAGLVVVAVGAVLWLTGKVGLPLGRLPGDVNLHGERWSFYLPITTCILLSVLLTVVVNLVIRMFR